MEGAAPVRVGQKVPDFSLDLYDPKTRGFGTFALGEALKKKKWVVLVFYPADFTFVCPTELRDTAEVHGALRKLGAEVISVSTDTKYVHLAWRDAEKEIDNVEFPMGADPTGAVARLFGVYDEKSGLALRGTFVINPEGVLVASEVNFYNVGRNAAELLRKMEANAYLAEHPDEACPAKWTRGQKTLKPSEKLVGKVGEALRK